MGEDAALAPSVSFDEARAAVEAFRRAAESAPEDNRIRLNVRHRLVPWLLTTSASRATPKTTPYASDLSALGRAREALERGDAPAAASALAEVATVDSASILSPESARRERALGFGPASWGNDFEQDVRAVSPEALDLYRRLSEGRSGREELASVQRLEAQARGHLEEALLLMAEKLRRAAAELERGAR
jgi:hypothetical protein